MEDEVENEGSGAGYAWGDAGPLGGLGYGAAAGGGTADGKGFGQGAAPEPMLTSEDLIRMYRENRLEELASKE